MITDDRRESMCMSKHAYTKRDAQTAVNSRRRGGSPFQNRRRHNPDPNLRAYQCDYCNYWHLTSKPDWQSRPERRKGRDWKF